MSYQKSDVHVSQPLSNFAVRYQQDDKNFIANKVVPQMPVMKEADKYFTYDRGSWRLSDDIRTAGTQSNRSTVAQLSTAAYLIEEYALHDVVPYRVIEEADAPLQPQQDTVADLMEQLMVSKESRAAVEMFATSAVQNYTSLAAASQWDYTSTTTPIDDVDTGNFSIQQEVGRMPNQATIGNEVWKVLKNHDDILDRIKYSQKGILTEDLVASVLDIDRLLIGRSLYMSTGEGVSSENVTYLWGKNFMLQYVETAPRAKSITHAKQFTKRGGVAKVKSFEDEKAGGMYTEVSTFYDFRIVSNLCGYTIFGCVG